MKVKVCASLLFSGCWDFEQDKLVSICIKNASLVNQVWGQKKAKKSWSSLKAQNTTSAHCYKTFYEGISKNQGWFKVLKCSKKVNVWFGWYFLSLM